MKKVIHLSDLHAGFEDLTSKLGEIVTRIIFNKTPAEDYVIVITGDLVEDATREGAFAEVSVHLDRLKEAGFILLPVMGNHDCGTGAWADVKCMKQFKKHFYGDAGTKFPKLDIIDEMAFIGLNSMADEVNWYDSLFSEGELGSAQLKRLKEILSSAEVSKCLYRIIYLHHHPFHPRLFHQLKDSEKLHEVLKDFSIDAILFGHNHDGRIWNGHWGIKRAYDGGTATGKMGKDNPHRVIDFSLSPDRDYDAHF